MQTTDNILSQVRAALAHNAHLDPVAHPVEINVATRCVTLAGEVPGIAAKRLAAAAAAAIEGVDDVDDRLRIVPTASLGDGAIRDAVCKWLARDVDFHNCTLRVFDSGRLQVLRDGGEDSSGAIDIAVEDGVITLRGHVISLSHKRLAGVLAWWSRGCRDVVNLLDLKPAEEDSDAEIIEALRLVFETDPLVHPEQIAIASRDYVVTLKGIVGTEEERRQAELDAWYLHGVRRVINEIEARP